VNISQPKLRSEKFDDDNNDDDDDDNNNNNNNVYKASPSVILIVSGIGVTIIFYTGFLSMCRTAQR